MYVSCPSDYRNHLWMSNTEVRLKLWFLRSPWKPFVSLLNLMSGLQLRKHILSVWGKSPGALIPLDTHNDGLGWYRSGTPLACPSLEFGIPPPRKHHGQHFIGHRKEGILMLSSCSGRGQGLFPLVGRLPRFLCPSVDPLPPINNDMVSKGQVGPSFSFLT